MLLDVIPKATLYLNKQETKHTKKTSKLDKRSAYSAQHPETPPTPSLNTSNSNLPPTPTPNRKLTITHIRQLPRLSPQPPARLPLILPPARRPSNKTSRHEVIVRRVRIPKHRVLHQPRNRPPERRPFAIPPPDA